MLPWYWNGSVGRSGFVHEIWNSFRHENTGIGRTVHIFAWHSSHFHRPQSFYCLHTFCSIGRNSFTNRYHYPNTNVVQQPLILRRRTDRRVEELAFHFSWLSVETYCSITIVSFSQNSCSGRWFCTDKQTDKWRNQLFIFHDYPLKLVHEIRPEAINFAPKSRQTRRGIGFFVSHDYLSKLTRQ